MRQRRQLRGQPKPREGLGDVRLPGAGALHALAEAVRLSELEAHAGRSRAQALATDVCAEGLPEALLFGTEIRGPCSQPPQHMLDLLALRIHGIAPVAGRDIAVERKL